MAFTKPIPDAVLAASVRTSLCCKMGNRNDGSDGTVDQQLCGVIGQNMILHALGQPMMEPACHHDNGVDFKVFNAAFDVKTMSRTVKPSIDFVNNFIASQAQFSPDAYLFASIDKTDMKLTVCGWIPKEELNSRAVLIPKGSVRTRRDGSTFTLKADTYEIKNADLNHAATSWPDLWHEIATWRG
jgi:hypothetical protein